MDTQVSEAGGFIGVLMLQTRFPRLPRDIGHAQALGAAPLRHWVVEGAHASRVVQPAQALLASGLLEPFARAAQSLAAQGARAITTSCGFLVGYQQALQAAVPVPVVTSSLLQLPGLLTHHARVGVLTIHAGHLSPAHLLAAGVPHQRLADVVVGGVDLEGAFARCILGDEVTMDIPAVQADLAAAAAQLQARAPDVREVVLECTNLPPHQAVIEAATGWRCHSLLDDPTLRAIAQAISPCP